MQNRSLELSLFLTLPAAIALMGYVNPVLACGEERFLDGCVKAGVDALILPDLPPPSPSIAAGFREMWPAIRRQVLNEDHFVKRELPPASACGARSRTSTRASTRGWEPTSSTRTGWRPPSRPA